MRALFFSFLLMPISSYATCPTGNGFCVGSSPSEFFIDASGNVMPVGTGQTIGNASNPWAKLTVSTITVNNTVTDNYQIVTQTLTVLGNAFSVGGSSFVVTAGQVGIGISTPPASFNLFINGLTGARPMVGLVPDGALSQVAGTIMSELSLYRSTSTSGNLSMLDFLGFSTNSSVAARISLHTEGSLSSGTIAIGYLTANGSQYNDVLTITSNTTVGIATSVPQSSLDVNGSFDWGTGSTKSTGTNAGALNLATPLTISNGGTGLTSDIRNTTNTWSAQQTFLNLVNFSSAIGQGGQSAMTFSGQAATIIGILNATAAGSLVTISSNIAAGAAGQIPQQSASGATVFLPAMAAGGVILGNGTGVIASTAALSLDATITSTGAVTVSKSSNLRFGSSGTLPYQSAADVTAMLAVGILGQYLQSAGAAAPSWVSIGTYTAYTPAYGGYTGGVTTNLARYSIIGKTVNLLLDFTGTSNATTLTFTLPSISANTLSTMPGCAEIDNGVSLNTPARLDMASASTTVTVYSTFVGGSWTASGAKALRCNFSYESQ